MRSETRDAERGMRSEDPAQLSLHVPHSALRTPRSALRVSSSSPLTNHHSLFAGFSLIEIILVLALIGIAAAILIPSVGGSFAVYHMERAGEDLQHRLTQTRLQAMETGVPYAFSFRPEDDQFMTWACEALNISQGLHSYGTTSSASAAASGDAYDRHYFELNNRDDNREFRFLSVNLSEPLTSMGLSSASRDGTAGLSSPDGVAASNMLARHKSGLAAVTARSMAALQIPGLQLGDVAPPLVFEPDGSVDRDAVIRIANRTGHYLEVNVQALTGSITVSSALSAEDAAAAGLTVTTTASSKSGNAIAAPSRSRETRGGR